MSDLLAIFTGAEDDASLVADIAAYRPDRVTVLVSDEDQDLLTNSSGEGDALRDRMAVLLAAIERETGATVVGLAGDRTQLAGWRFDRELGSKLPVAA
ncbi:MAG TPA: hypothetical protein VII87_04305 [Solirubrobacteraceae bacterium]|jgi:hypothetical protein